MVSQLIKVLTAIGKATHPSTKSNLTATRTKRAKKNLNQSICYGSKDRADPYILALIAFQ